MYIYILYYKYHIDLHWDKSGQKGMALNLRMENLDSMSIFFYWEFAEALAQLPREVMGASCTEVFKARCRCALGSTIYCLI